MRESLKSEAVKLGKELKADSVSIEVGFPWDI
jgi:hypothetical protein